MRCGAGVLGEVASISHVDELPVLGRSHCGGDIVPTLFVLRHGEEASGELADEADRDHIFSISIEARGFLLGRQAPHQLGATDIGDVVHCREVGIAAATRKVAAQLRPGSKSGPDDEHDDGVNDLEAAA